MLPSGQGDGETLTVRLVDTGSERHQHRGDRGKPTISGMATVGGTLTAGTSGIADADGKTKAENGDTGFAYTYQWVRVDEWLRDRYFDRDLEDLHARGGRREQEGQGEGVVQG